VRDFLYAVRAEPDSAALIAANVVGLVLVVWLLVIA
jgi:hypothetical protein